MNEWVNEASCGKHFESLSRVEQCNIRTSPLLSGIVAILLTTGEY